VATRTAEYIFQRYFDGDPWVATDTPISSIDDRVTAAVLGQAQPQPVALPVGSPVDVLPATGPSGPSPLLGAAALGAAGALLHLRDRGSRGHAPGCPED
jgi:hypothetical protein